MNHKSILRQLDDERRQLARDGEIIEILPHVTRFRTPDDSHHAILYASLADDADSLIAAEVSHYCGLGKEFEWKVYAHDQPADLIERLRRREFEIGPQEAVLVLDLADHPDWIDAPTPHEVIRVDRLEQVDLFRAAAEEIFGKDYSFTATALADAIGTGSNQHRGYIALSEGKAVSIGRLYTHPMSAFGGLYGGGTLRSHRGRGFYRALIAARARDAMSLGARYLIVDALPTSCPILQRLGFDHITDTWPCVWQPRT